MEKTNSQLSYFQEGAQFVGKIFTKANIRIESQIDADITALKSIIIEKKALIKGDIVASSIICSGEVNGNIQCSDVAEIKSSGKIIGNINSTNLIVEKGGSILGECRVNQDSIKF